MPHSNRQKTDSDTIDLEVAGSGRTIPLIASNMFHVVHMVVVDDHLGFVAAGSGSVGSMDVSESLEISSVTEDIAAPIEVVWPIISDFEGVERIFPREGVAGIPPIEKVNVDGRGVGAVRTAYLVGGLRGVERLESMDSLNHTYSYVMLPPLIVPVDDYVATISAVSLDVGSTRIHYRSHGRLRDVPSAEIRPLLVALHSALIEGVRRLSISSS